MKKNRPNDVIEIPNCCHVFLNAYIWSFQVLGLFLQYLMFFLRDNQQGILSYQSQQLPCRAREAEHITYFLTYCSVWTVLYMETFFLSVNR